ncbi:MAG TPA: DUF4062 domain-containing protein [Xanthobacteraceae bacterium]|jgi:hypothetical protein|nr:DUF4062 domain-containing protein [Xanthobacteraceae bacterium]
MDKRYQVFVSSTFADLKEERQAVMQALLSLDHFPAGMELFPASDDDQWALIKGVIDDSDYYVLVIGGRYGSTSPSGLSYTEMEFNYAVSTKKPILAFIHEKPDDIPAGKTDQNDKLQNQLSALKKKVETGRHVKYWRNPDDLKAKVIQAAAAETKRNPQEGWIRASRAVDPAITELMRQEIDRLKSELSSVTSEAPKDSQMYAGGDDRFTVDLSYRDKDYDLVHDDIAVRWNIIFSEVGPVLLEEATEKQMKLRLSNELWLYQRDKFPDDASSVNIDDDSFDTIKIQLLALGLIRKSQKKHVPSDTNLYWSLTPYGETVLMKLRAILKAASYVTKGSSVQVPTPTAE